MYANAPSLGHGFKTKCQTSPKPSNLGDEVLTLGERSHPAALRTTVATLRQVAAARLGKAWGLHRTRSPCPDIDELRRTTVEGSNSWIDGSKAWTAPIADHPLTAPSPLPTVL